MQIKITAFNGSPRRDGNTEILLNKCIEGVESQSSTVTVFNLNDMDILPCQDCSKCYETGECIYNDDMNQIYEAIRTSNRIILTSPVFFFGISAQAKAMVDRCQSFWSEKYLLKSPLPQENVKRRGLFIVVGGMKAEVGYTCTQATAKAFFRTISVDEHKNLSYSGFDEKGAILKEPEALKQAFEAGRDLTM